MGLALRRMTMPKAPKRLWTKVVELSTIIIRRWHYMGGRCWR
jgi:hypothetical protein